MKTGMVVRSRAGRDSGSWLVILSTEGDFALVADGKARPLARPKKKRLKHLAPTNRLLEPGEYETDRRLRGALAAHVGLKEGCDLGKR